MANPKELKKNLPGLWRISRYFWPQLRHHRALAAGSLLALFGEVALRLLEPWPLKFVFDRIFPIHAGKISFSIPAIDALDSQTLLIVAAVSLVIISGLRALVSYWSTIGIAMIGNRVLTKVRNQLYRHVQYLSLSFHTRAKTGDVVVRVINDVGMLQDVAVTALLPTLAKVLIVTGMVGLMLWLQWKLALLALSVLPLFWLKTSRATRKMKEVASRQRERQGAMAATAAESINAIKTVQALSLESTFTRAFASENDRSFKEEVKGKKLAAGLGRSMDVLIGISTALTLWYGGRLVLRQEITAGDLLVFLSYLRYAYRPVQDFAKYAGRLAKAGAAGERVLDLLERVPDVRDLPDAARAPAFSGRLQFDHVSFAYERGQRLFDHLDLDIRPGQHVALVGASGSGKSTLASLILRLYDPHKGRVLIDGQDIRKFTLESLRAQISVVLQDNLLFAASVRDNIAHAAPGATPEQVEAVARLANAHEFIQSLPRGYDTVIGERGVTLSHGQRQRIAIARAAIRQAPILILDEPTTGLDKKSERSVLDALERLYQGRTTFLISHDLRQAARADLILYLEDGKIIERGTPDELMRANGRYATLCKLQDASPAGDTTKPNYAHTS